MRHVLICKHFKLFRMDLIERKRWCAINSNLLGHLQLAVFYGDGQHDLCGQSILVVLAWILVCFILAYSVACRQVFYLCLFYFTTHASTTLGGLGTGMVQWYGPQCPVSPLRCRIQAFGPPPKGSSLFLC
jgi:hypothetical protein